MKKYIVCTDKFDNELGDGDFVDVQKAGIHKVYKKVDGQLWFNPYPNEFGEEMVSSYFSNDMVKCDEVGNWLGCT